MHDFRCTRTDLTFNGNSIVIHQEFYSGFSECETLVTARDCTGTFTTRPVDDWTRVKIIPDKLRYYPSFDFQKNKDGLIRTVFLYAAPTVDRVLPPMQLYRQADYDVLIQRRKDEAAKPPNMNIVQQEPHPFTGGF